MKDIWYFLRLSRPVNVLITLVSLLVAAHISSEFQFKFLSDLDFWLAVFPVLAVTATGYWINDVFDFRIDRINKPDKLIVSTHLSRKKVVTAYIVAHILLVGYIVVFLPLEAILLNVFAAALLFFYAFYFKRVSVAGNLMIALLTCLVILYPGLFYAFTWPLLWAGIFAFEITFAREVVKDMEDIRGDVRHGLQTLPIRIGLRSTKIVLGVFYLFFLFTCYLPIVEQYFWDGFFNLGYLIASILLVQLPVIYLLIKLRKSKRPEDFSSQSLILKLLIFAGIVALLLLQPVLVI